MRDCCIVFVRFSAYLMISVQFHADKYWLIKCCISQGTVVTTVRRDRN